MSETIETPEERLLKNKETKLQLLWERILRLNPTNEDFCDIIKDVKILEDRAWTEFARRNPTPRQLHWIKKNAPKFTDKADKLLEVALRREIIAKMIKLSE